MEAFLTPPRGRELSREQVFLDRAETTRVRLGPTTFARGGGDEINIYQWGDGPTVLFIHGWGSRAGHLEALITRATAGGMKAVAFDAPGHGRSGGTITSAPAFAVAIETVVRQHGPFGRVVAHSVGAVALSLTLGKMLEVRRVSLLGSCCWVAPSLLAFAQAQGASQELIDVVLQAARDVFRPEEESAEEAVRAFGGIAALLIHDPQDVEMPYENSVALAKAWPGAVLEPVAGVGHRQILRAKSVVSRAIDYVSV